MRLEYRIQDFIHRVGGEETITLALISILLFAIIFVFLKRTPMFKEKENHAVAGIVSLAITILSVYYISQSQLIQLMQAYNIFGLIVLFFIPFLIFGTMLHLIGKTPAIRRIGWVAFGILFIYLYSTSQYSTEGTGLGIGVIIIILAIIFDKLLNKEVEKEAKQSGVITVPINQIGASRN